MPQLPPPAPPAIVRPARGDPAAWFSPNDYPVAALRQAAQGRTVARIAIGADGRVTGCTIASSSGDADLDRATCAVTLRRARYLPARAADGAPIASSLDLPVRWALPSDADAAPPPAERDRSPRFHGWFERVMAAHHLIGGLTAAAAFLGERIRRRLVGGGGRPADGRPDGDRLPPRRRWAWRHGRWARIGLAAGPAILLATVMAWLGW